jgi:DNA-directed RNA polymerase specialized sigma24 family protein
MSRAVNDGFGDDLSVEEMLRDEEEFFVRNARHALVKKYGRGFREGEDQDAIQEARIAAWMSWEKNHNRAFLNIATRQRLMAHVYRDQWFGTKPTAHEKDPLRRANRDSFDDPDNGIDVVLDSATWIDQVLLGYHSGEIVEALNALTFTQREYVVLRFWGGFSNVEIAAMQGKTPGGVGAIWSRDIKPQLVDKLELLADMV